MPEHDYVLTEPDGHWLRGLRRAVEKGTAPVWGDLALEEIGELRAKVDQLTRDNGALAAKCAALESVGDDLYDLVAGLEGWKATEAVNDWEVVTQAHEPVGVRDA